MRTLARFFSSAVLAAGLALTAVTPALAESPKSKDEVALEAAAESTLQIRRELFRARQQGDKEKIKELEKQFKEVQDERVRLLRKTWQM